MERSASKRLHMPAFHSFACVHIRCVGTRYIFISEGCSRSFVYSPGRTRRIGLLAKTQNTYHAWNMHVGRSRFMDMGAVGTITHRGGRARTVAHTLTSAMTHEHALTSHDTISLSHIHHIMMSSLHSRHVAKHTEMWHVMHAVCRNDVNISVKTVASLARGKLPPATTRFTFPGTLR